MSSRILGPRDAAWTAFRSHHAKGDSVATDFASTNSVTHTRELVVMGIGEGTYEGEAEAAQIVAW